MCHDRRGGMEEMEDAVKLLVEHLVMPVLPRGPEKRYMAPEEQRAVAQQIHTAIILYNYYHRKMFPELEFLDAKMFLMCASITTGEDLLRHLSTVHEHEDESGKPVRSYTIDRAPMQACEIAEGLDASKDSPDMTWWPISKVAVLLLDPTRKKCLIEHSANTTGVWSIIEKEIDASPGNSANQGTSGALVGPCMLQQLARSEVEHRTGMKGSNLRVLHETLTYSLSKEKTTTKLFIMEYEETMKGNLVEMSLEVLIRSMTSPVCVNVPFPKTTAVVEYYHILPYKDILFELLHREWPSDGNVEVQYMNSTSEEKAIKKESTPKQSKQAIGAKRSQKVQNSRTSRLEKNSKRNIEASRVTDDVYADDLDGERPAIQIDSRITNETTTTVEGGKTIVLQDGVQMGENKKQKQSICNNIPQDIFPTEAPCVDPVMKNGSLECQNMEVLGKSGGITKNDIDQMYDSLQPLQKIRDDILHKEIILQDRSAQCERDIQIILSEWKMTPKVLSIMNTYKESSNMTEVDNLLCSRDGGQNKSTKRKGLREALQRDKCKELDKICYGGNWIPPRYTVVPSVVDGMFHANVRIMCPDCDMTIAGDPRRTPHEARFSAAGNMIMELNKKAEEQEQET